MRDVQEEQVDIVGRNGEPVVDNMESKEHLKQASLEPSTGIQLKRSNRKRQLSRRYSVDEAIKLSRGYATWPEKWVVKSHARRDEILAWEPHIWFGGIA
jgi:hypothetical protein